MRSCKWCHGEVPAGSRADAVFCSTRCRQAYHRLRRGRGLVVASSSETLRFAYADPPYPGKSSYYRGHADFAGEVEHADLIRRLELYDGWALSTSAEALRDVLALCPPASRVAAWVRGACGSRSYHPMSSWEPVIYWGGRAQLSRRDLRRVDSLVAGVGVRTTDPGRVIGAKPPAFCYWLFSLLGACRGDVLEDLFPGSGVVSRCWELYVGSSS